MSPSGRALLFVAVGVALLAAPVHAANRETVSTCQPLDTAYHNFVDGYRTYISGVDPLSINVRSHFNLPQLPDDSVTAVTNSSTCNRAAIAYDRKLTVPDTTTPRHVYVARVGSTRYIVGDP